MGDSGYTATEKTKILYEESLKDIKDLTARLEAVSEMVLKSNKLAEFESTRVSFSQQISRDISQKDRQKTFVWAAATMSLFGMVLLGAGFAIGSQVGLGSGFLAALSLGIGVVGGMLLCQALIAGDQVISFSKNEGVAQQPKTVSNFAWTTETIVMAGKSKKLSSRVVAACQNVLLNGESHETAAKREQLFAAQVKRAVVDLNDWKENQ